MNNSWMIMLLCSHLGKSELLKPFSNVEINKIILKLKDKNLELKDIYLKSIDEIKLLFFDSLVLDLKEQEFIDRYCDLLTSEGSLGFELEKIKKWGIDVVTIFDEKYPQKFLNAQFTAPALLYYAGDLSILNNKFIGFTGSRNAKKEDEFTTKVWVETAIKNGYSIISGGASGIDTFATKSAIMNDAVFVEFLANSMIERIKIAQISNSINNGKALILSASKPDAPFNTGMAMARNKYIYEFSDKVIAVRATYKIKDGKKTGGTWNGAIDNLKSENKKLFVLENGSKESKELIKLGGIGLSNLPNSKSIDLFINYNNEVKVDVDTEYDDKMFNVLKTMDIKTDIKLSKAEKAKVEIFKEKISTAKSFNDLSKSPNKMPKGVLVKVYEYCYGQMLYGGKTLFDFENDNNEISTMKKMKL